MKKLLLLILILAAVETAFSQQAVKVDNTTHQVTEPADFLSANRIVSGTLTLGQILLGGTDGNGHATTLDTSIVPENGILYFTTARARAAVSGASGINYNSSTGVLTINNGYFSNIALSGSFADLLGKPTTLSGYGITDPVALTNGSYANPAWITSLAYSKLTGAPTTWAWSAITSTPTTQAGYGIVDVINTGTATGVTMDINSALSGGNSKVPTDAAIVAYINSHFPAPIVATPAGNYTVVAPGGGAVAGQRVVYFVTPSASGTLSMDSSVSIPSLSSFGAGQPITSGSLYVVQLMYSGSKWMLTSFVGAY